METCRYCGSSELKTELTPALTHHGKVVCKACGRSLRWLPRPVRVITKEIVHSLAPFALDDEAPLPELEGTPAQVDFAAKVRALALPRLEGQLGRNLYRLTRGVTSAPWWISNGKRSPQEIRWPDSWFEAAEIVGERRA